jgi:hypothetical protein
VTGVSSSIESFVDMLGALGAPHGDATKGMELVPQRLFLAINSLDEPELYVSGPRASFSISGLSQVVSWDRFVLDGSGEPTPALVVRTGPGVEGRRVMGHIAYEAFRLVADGVDNQELLERLNPFLLLAQSKRVLQPAEQTGLVGELLFLKELLTVCNDAARQQQALTSWVGPLGAQHDFYRNALVVEVKSGPGTSHRVGYHQLLPSGDEELFLASARVRRDPSAQLKLPDLVEQIAVTFSSEKLRSELYGRLEKYGSGYYADSADHYRLDQGFDVGPVEVRRITADSPILTPRSFSPGQPPLSVSDIRYVLDVSGMPILLPGDKRALLVQLVDLED